MTRAWWGRRRETAPESHKTAPVSDSGALDDQSRRVNRPEGSTVWICSTAAGRKGCGHEPEAEAEAHGEREGRCWWPVIVDEGMSA